MRAGLSVRPHFEIYMEYLAPHRAACTFCHSANKKQSRLQFNVAGFCGSWLSHESISPGFAIFQSANRNYKALN